MSLTLTDLFAGAGGSSTGATQNPNVEVRLAANHWDKAVEVHNENHPGADHLCADISAYDPRRVRRTDLLWASPECTNHSRAKGRPADSGQPDLFGETLPDAASERSRATMWDVPRFTEAHDYAAIVVENVVEVTQWAPFRAWLLAMASYGYDHHIVSLNSMHAQTGGAPAPQSRDRVYIVFWKKSNQRPNLEVMQRPRAWCGRCESVVDSRQTWKPGRKVGRYRQQYVYTCPTCHCAVEPGWLPASAAIDWSIQGTRIGDRKRPLADKTRARIAAGIARYWQPMHMEMVNSYDATNPKHPRHGDPEAYYRIWPTDTPLRTLPTMESKALIVQTEGRAGDPRTVGQPLRTQTARHLDGLLVPLHVSLMGSRAEGSARPVNHELRTLTAEGNNDYLLTPYYGGSKSAQAITEPIGTLTTRDRYALVGSIEAAKAQVDDCLFRMLEPHEIAAGMAFPSTYKWAGNRRERVRMAGNAVTPPAARDLIGAVVESLGGAA